MILIPAIDIRDGRAVRLRQGDFAQETVYGDDPVAVAKGYEAAGARWIHMVDLDGALTGEPANRDAILAVRAAVTCKLQAGGGVRDGNVSVSGWTKATQMPAEDVIERMQRHGATRFVYTSVDRDGMLEGPDLEEVRRISAVVRGRFLYSGGIGSAEHLAALKGLRLVNLAGVVSGKALYEKRFTVAEGNQALSG